MKPGTFFMKNGVVIKPLKSPWPAFKKHILSKCRWSCFLFFFFNRMPIFSELIFVHLCFDSKNTFDGNSVEIGSGLDARAG